jgi:hypothetical protein
LNLSLTNLSPLFESESLNTNSPSRTEIALTNAPGQTLQGLQQVAALAFTAASNQPSGILPLLVTDLQARRSDGTLVVSLADGPGRVIVVGEEPVLEATHLPNGQMRLTVYGVPGTTVSLETATELSTPILWMPWMDVTLTDVVHLIEPVPRTSTTLFIRARR